MRWRQAFHDLVQDCLVYRSEVRKQLAHDPDNPPVAYMAQALRSNVTDMMRELGAEMRAKRLCMACLNASRCGFEDAMLLPESLHNGRAKPRRFWPVKSLQESSR